MIVAGSEVFFLALTKVVFRQFQENGLSEKPKFVGIQETIDVSALKSKKHKWDLNTGYRDNPFKIHLSWKKDIVVPVKTK